MDEEPRAPAEDLDPALTRRLSEVVADAAPTESELRALAAGGDALARTLSASIRSSEAHLAVLADDPASTVAAIAAELRRIERLRTELDDLHADLRALDRRARTLRGRWLGSDAAR